MRYSYETHGGVEGDKREQWGAFCPYVVMCCYLYRPFEPCCNLLLPFERVSIATYVNI